MSTDRATLRRQAFEAIPDAALADLLAWADNLGEDDRRGAQRLLAHILWVRMAVPREKVTNDE